MSDFLNWAEGSLMVGVTPGHTLQWQKDGVQHLVLCHPPSGSVYITLLNGFPEPRMARVLVNGHSFTSVEIPGGELRGVLLLRAAPLPWQEEGILLSSENLTLIRVEFSEQNAHCFAVRWATAQERLRPYIIHGARVA